MNKLQKLHSQAIKNETFFSDYSYSERMFNAGGDIRAAITSAEITKDIAIEFLRWAVSNPLMSNTSSMSKETAEYFFDEFLKTIK